MSKSGIESLTAREMAIAEQKAGVSLATLEDPNYPKANLIIALGWVLAKREDATLTFEAYGDSKTLAEITEDLGIGEDVDDEGNA